MVHNETYIAHEWIGQDGAEYRDKMVWIGAGYKSIMQKKNHLCAWSNV